MLNIIDNVITYLKARTTPYAAISNNIFPGASSEEIVVRADPSPKREVEYLDGSAQSSLQFTFLTKSKNQRTAREQLETFISVLNMCPGIDLTNTEFVKIESVTQPYLVSYNDSKEYEFAADFKIIFE